MARRELGGPLFNPEQRADLPAEPAAGDSGAEPGPPGCRPGPQRRDPSVGFDQLWQSGRAWPAVYKDSTGVSESGRRVEAGSRFDLT